MRDRSGRGRPAARRRAPRVAARCARSGRRPRSSRRCRTPRRTPRRRGSRGRACGTRRARHRRAAARPSVTQLLGRRRGAERVLEPGRQPEGAVVERAIELVDHRPLLVGRGRPRRSAEDRDPDGVVAGQRRRRSPTGRPPRPPRDTRRTSSTASRARRGSRSVRSSIAAGIGSGAGEWPQLPTTIVVTPWAIALRARGSARTVTSAWLWMSMKPGATTRPVASISVVAVTPGSGPTSTIRSPVIATSVTRGGPSPPITVPPRISRSITSQACGRPAASAPRPRTARPGPGRASAVRPPSRRRRGSRRPRR